VGGVCMCVCVCVCAICFVRASREYLRIKSDGILRVKPDAVDDAVGH
jgi:hypothetical protein